jgi:hypothetical protein
MIAAAVATLDPQRPARFIDCYHRVHAIGLAHTAKILQ